MPRSDAQDARQGGCGGWTAPQEPLSKARPGEAGAELIGIVNGKSRDAVLLNGFADGTDKVALQGYVAGEVAKDIATAGGQHQDHVR